MHVCLSSQVFLIVDDCAQVKFNPHIVREETHGGGELIQIAAAQLRGVHGMWGITRSRINVKSSDDLTWESGGAKTPMDNPDRYQGPGIPYLLYDIGGNTAMPRGGVPRETGNEYGNVGALGALACPQHHGDDGGRKITPPTVRQV